MMDWKQEEGVARLACGQRTEARRESAAAP